ncbi:cilia- and flagella-associated protein 61-like [Anastrepha obliqua]|uniref:cilia- and flagella-associated protein 61-like n=1 Tax=Anastrepha obliqua TaxID=95512 RepID=UPI00240A252A|nr:cilia- and flagella-associated protein 61-like [Anastrepha obliqua]
MESEISFNIKPSHARIETDVEENLYIMSGITNIERDFGYISNMLRWKEIRFFGPSPHGFHNASDFFSEYSTQRVMVRKRVADVTIIGYAEFSYYPLIGALPPDCWTNWLQHHFCTTKEYNLNRGDTMFFTRFIFFPKYNPTLLLRILNEFFHREFKIYYVVILEMPTDPNMPPEDTPCYDMLQGMSTILYPRNFSVQQCHNVQRIHIIHRNNVIERMRYRRALPEDNDDIVEVIDVDRPDLREEYGDFYIAEELLKEMDEGDKHNTFIACELQHQTVGFIWLNDDVNVLALVENFECEGFGNMIKFSADKPSFDKRVVVSGTEKKPYYSLFTSEAIEEIYEQELHTLTAATKKMDSSKTCKSPTCPKYPGKCLVTSIPNQDGTNFNYGISDTDNDYFRLREEFLRKMQILETCLKSHEHYQLDFRKRLRIPYNVPDTHKVDNDRTFPFDAYPNVFAIKLLGINEATDTRFASRFIAVAFTAHPDRDYCVISIPNRMNLPRSVAMLLGLFVSLVPRPGSKIDDTVYIINRSSIFGYMGVMNALPEDVPFIEKLVKKSTAMLNKRASTFSVVLSKQSLLAPPETLVESKLIRTVLADVFENPNSEYNFLTIRCGDPKRPLESNTIVGFVIVRPFNKQQELEYKYNCMRNETRLKCAPGEIVVLRLHPNYTWESDVIFRQISCVTGYWEFYYLQSTMSGVKALTNDLVKQMQPIEPREIAQFHRRDSNEPTVTASTDTINPLDFKNDSFAFYYHNLLPSKPFGNSEPIVILGFNSMTRALLRILLFNFINSSEMKCHCCLPRPRVTIVSPMGVVEGIYDRNFKCSVCEDQSNCYVNTENSNSFIRDTLSCMDFRKFFCFTSSNVKMINREERKLVLVNGCELLYQSLIFALSQRFGVPPAVQREQRPSNYMHMNNRFDKIIMYYKLEALLNDRNANDINIIVFGSRLGTFEFINFLITHNTPPQAITLVLPWDPRANANYMKYNISNMDINIETILQEMTEDLGVKVKANYVLKKWIYYENEKIISHAVFENQNDGNIMTLACDLFASFHSHVISTEVLDIMANADIEMDGLHILIDENYRTSDPNIFAVGNCARLRVTPNHQYTHCAKDELAAKLINSLNLNLNEKAEHSEKFIKPVYFQAQLPLGYFMAKVILPKLYIARHLDNSYVVSLNTYDGNFSRVRINEHGIVEEIVCVAKTKRSFDHLQYFVGKHETLLNDLHVRWYLKGITSFVDFFEEPWTELIMHPGFDDLRRKIRILALDTAKEVMSMDPQMDRRTRKEFMKRHMAESKNTHEVEKALLRFLRKNRDDFIYPFALPEDFHLNLASKLNM